MHRIFTLLLLLGVLAGLFSGRYVHAAWVTDSGECSVVHPVYAEATECDYSHASLHPHHHAEMHAAHADHHQQDDCADAKGGHCHQHACQHTISPGVNAVYAVFLHASLLIGSVPAATVPSIDEPVYELDTPPLI